MAKFRRVAETQGVPDYVENYFIPESKQNDIYAHLKNSVRQHKQIIAGEQVGITSAEIAPKEWETIKSAATYETPKMSLDNTGTAIRRLSYDVDEGLNARAGQYDFNQEDLITAMINGPTIFNNEMDELAEHLTKKNLVKDAVFSNGAQRQADIDNKRQAWESERLEEINPSIRSSSRANGIIRTSMENISDGAFNIPNYASVDTREEQRRAMMDEKRARSLAIKMNGKSPEDNYKNWIENVDLKSKSYQTQQVDWLEGFVDEN